MTEPKDNQGGNSAQVGGELGNFIIDRLIGNLITPEERNQVNEMISNGVDLEIRKIASSIPAHNNQTSDSIQIDSEAFPIHRFTINLTSLKLKQLYDGYGQMTVHEEQFVQAITYNTTALAMRVAYANGLNRLLNSERRESFNLQTDSPKGLQTFESGYLESFGRFLNSVGALSNFLAEGDAGKKGRLWIGNPYFNCRSPIFTTSDPSKVVLGVNHRMGRQSATNDGVPSISIITSAYYIMEDQSGEPLVDSQPEFAFNLAECAKPEFQLAYVPEQRSLR